MSSNPVDIFVHIPRTGGTSLTITLLMEYGARGMYKCYRNGCGDYSLGRNINASRKCVITGHVPFGVHRHLGIERARYFTILRDPLSRLISYYRYVVNTRRHYLHQQVVRHNLSIEAFLTSGISPELENGAVRQLSGCPTAFQSNVDFDELYEMAEENLSTCAAVGVLESYRTSISLFHEKLGWKCGLRDVQENGTQDQSNTDPTLRQRLIEIVAGTNKKDILLYNKASECLHKEAGDVVELNFAPISRWKLSILRNMHRAVEKL